MKFKDKSVNVMYDMLCILKTNYIMRLQYTLVLCTRKRKNQKDNSALLLLNDFYVFVLEFKQTDYSDKNNIVYNIAAKRRNHKIIKVNTESV